MSRKPTTDRKERRPMGGRRLRLEAPKVEGMYSRWINDEPGRLEEAQEAGYTFRVDGDTKSDSPDTRITRHVGGGKKAYLMDLPQGFRDEDVAKAQARIDAKEASIFRSREIPDGGLGNDPTAYTHTATIRRGS